MTNSQNILLAVLTLSATAALVVYNIPKNASAFRGENDSMKNLFIAFKSQYGKTYKSSAEELERFNIFVKNVEYINEWNHNKLNTHTLGINFMADMTAGERKVFMGYKGTQQNDDSNIEYLETDSLPSSVNWVKKGAVTSVKNQGDCGGCYSFTSAGALEGLNVIRGGPLTSFSEQQILDCSYLYGNQACMGGLITQAFQYTAVKGIESLKDYPYTAQSSLICKYNKSKVAFQHTGYKQVQANSAEALAAAVAQQPVSVAIEADQTPFIFYSGGVITSKCGQTLDHGVLIVGYDDTGSQPYWLVKNSWGNQWGLEGYAKILKSDANVCGVLSAASYPTKN